MRPPIKSSTVYGRSSPRYRVPPCSSRRRRTSTWAAGPPARSISTRCRIRTSMSSTTGRRGCSRSCRSCPCCATWPPTTSVMLSLTIDRDAAARYGFQPAAVDNALYDAYGQRQAAQFFTQANSYHVVLEITPSLQTDPSSLSKLYMKSPLNGQMVPLSAMTRFDTRRVTYLSINHQGQFPSVTISFNLAPGAALGDAGTGTERVSARRRRPPPIPG